MTEGHSPRNILERYVSCMSWAQTARFVTALGLDRGEFSIRLAPAVLANEIVEKIIERGLTAKIKSAFQEAIGELNPDHAILNLDLNHPDLSQTRDEISLDEAKRIIDAVDAARNAGEDPIAAVAGRLEAFAASSKRGAARPTGFSKG